MSENNYNHELRDKLDSRQFEVNGHNWHKLVPELEKLKKKKKRRFIFYFLFAGIGLTTLLFFILQNTNEPIASKQITGQSPFAPTESSALHQQQAKNRSTGKTEQSKNSNNDQNINEASATENKTGVVSNEQMINPENGKPEGKNEKESGVSESTFKHNSPGKQQIGMKKAEKESNPSETIVKNQTSQKDKTKDQSKTAEEQKNNFADLNQNDTTGKVTSVAKTEPETTAKIQVSDSLAAVTDTTGSQDSTLALNSPAAGTIQPNQDSSKENHPSTEFYIGAYLAFTPGYGSSFSFSEALNPSLGLGVRKFFTPTIGIGAGLFYTIYGNVGNDPKVFYSTQQDFGYKSSVVEIRQSKLHYLRLPLTLEFRYRKNNFSIGPEFMYLVTSSSTVQNYTEAYGSVSDKTSKKEYGYLGGFRRYDIGAILNYTRRLNQKLYLSLLLNAGFIDVKNNVYFNDVVFDRNKSVQIGLNYKF